MIVFKLALHQMLILAFLAAIGCILRKKELLTEQGISGLSAIVMNVGLPAMILSAFDMEYVAGTGSGILITALLSVIVIALSGGIGRIFAKWIHCPQNRRGSWLHALMISNCGLIGFVIIYALYSGTALVYASIMVLVVNICTGLYIPLIQKKSMLSKSEMPAEEKNGLMKILLRPITLAPVVGLIFYLTPLRYPAFARDILGILNGLCSPLALFVAGAGLANARIKEIIRDRMISLYSFLRLLAIPAILLMLLRPIPLENNIKIILIVGSAMPAPGLTPIIAAEYKADVSFASEIVFISTMLSVITIPFVTAAVDVLL